MDSNKVYISPSFKHAERADGGIRRVWEALVKYLPTFGWEVVDTPEEADVIHCHAGNLVEIPGKPILNSSHGIYWAEYEWPNWAAEANAGLVQAMASAQAQTAPSEWVGNALKRGLAVNPTVVYHGVEADEWTVRPSQGYVLWNKARADVVSDPTDYEKLAELMPDTPFVATISHSGFKRDNVQVVGVMRYQAMKMLVEFAGVYLATARETFGIGTLEALAAGVPVAGWDYGGQSEIIQDGETGYLAPYGDYPALAECVSRCLSERARLSQNCRADSLKRWGWQDKIKQYADTYNRLLTEERRQKPKVSVIIPSYNLGAYLPQAVKSVQAQTISDWELLIVDDNSTDFSWAIAQEFSEYDGRIRVFKTPRNQGLCATRNLGISKARGRYIQFLDADDLLTPHALAVCSEVLDHEPGIHIAYGHLDVINETGTSAARNNWPAKDFSWYRQMAHLNEPHYSAMVRREVYDRCGGYRWRMRKAEDAWFWCYATSFGFRAEKVTDITTLLWRSRSNSKSIVERQEDSDTTPDGDWTGEFPWAIAHSADEANTMARETGGYEMRRGWLVPFGAQGSLPEGLFWKVPHCEKPTTHYFVNGLGLGPYCDENYQKLINTLDTILLQENKDWACQVVVPGDWPEVIPGAAWANVDRYFDGDDGFSVGYEADVRLTAGEVIGLV